MTEDASNKDFDFEKFCSALKAENPDMTLIKTGVEKYGTGQLTDSQKAQFLKSMFPEPVVKNGKKVVGSLGFQNMAGIKNALNAIKALHDEKKIDDAAMLNFLSEKNPENGKNVMTTIALNTRAAEFKLEHTTKEEIREELSGKMEDLKAIQATLGQINHDSEDVFVRAACTPDKSDGPLKRYVDIAERSSHATQRDSVLKENYETIKPKIAQVEEDIRQQESDEAAVQDPSSPNANDNSGTFRVGGAQNNPPALNVEEQDEEKVADIDTRTPEDKAKSERIKLSPVKEQDIIDFMFSEWFLAPINWVSEKLVNLAYDTVCYAARPNTPNSTATATATRGTATVPPTRNSAAQRVMASYQNIITSNSANSMMETLSKDLNPTAYTPEEIASVFTRALDDIKQNIGKEPKDWKLCKVINPKRQANLIKQWNAKYRENPGAFMQMLADREKAVAAIAPQQLADVSKLAATYAFLDYVSETGSVGKELSNKAKKKIYTKHKLILNDILKTGTLIRQDEVAKHILEHPELRLSANTSFEKLPPEAQKEVTQKASKRFLEFLRKDQEDANKVMEFVVKGVTAESDKERNAAKKSLKESHEKIQEIISSFGKPLPTDEGSVRNQEHNEKPRGVDEEARRNNRADERDKKVGEDINREQNVVNGDKEKNRGRKNKFKQRVNIILNGKNNLFKRIGRNQDNSR